jgi:hypothetical protein
MTFREIALCLVFWPLAIVGALLMAMTPDEKEEV